jgi:hypothetical protein
VKAEERQTEMKPSVKAVCSEKDRHASEADAYAAASRWVGMAFDEAG